MDLSNKELVLEEVKKRFPLGSTVIDKDGDYAVMNDYKYMGSDSHHIYMNEPDKTTIFLYIKGKWSTIVKTAPESASSSPLQSLFYNLLNP